MAHYWGGSTAPCIAAGMLLDISNNVQINGSFMPSGIGNLGGENSRWSNMYLRNGSIDLGGALFKKDNETLKIEHKNKISQQLIYTSTQTPLVMIGSETPFYDVDTDTSTIPLGWEELIFPDNDEDYVNIPDIGFDFFILNNNIRDKIQVYTNHYITLDGMSLNPEYNADEDSPSTLTIHYGSLDGYSYRVFYKWIYENDVFKGIVIRQEGAEYNNQIPVFPVEITFLTTNVVRISIPDNCPLYRLGLGNWGISDGTRWLHRLDNIVEKNKSYLFKQEIVTKKTDINNNISLVLSENNFKVDKTTAQSIVVIPAVSNDNNDIVQSKFTNINYTDSTDFNFENKPDVIFLNTPSISNPNNLLELVTNGTVLYVQMYGFNSDLNNIFNLSTNITTEYIDLETDINNAIVDISTNPIIKAKTLGYYSSGNKIDVTFLDEDVQILGQKNGYAIIFMKQVGQGYVIVDLLNQSGVSYRTNVFNDLFDYISNNNKVTSNLLEIDTSGSLISKNIIIRLPSENKYPVVDLSANTSIISNQEYGNGEYVISASFENADVGYLAFYAFSDIRSNGGYWGAPDKYDYNTGEYTGNVSTIVDGNPISGEWLQIKLPTSIIVKSYVVGSTNGSYNLERLSPRNFVLAGSNDGVTWNTLDIQSNLTWKTYNNEQYEDKIFNINNSTSYSYYRIITSMTGNPGMSDGLNIVGIALFRLYESHPTNSQDMFKIVKNDYNYVKVDTNGNVGIGVTTPMSKLHINDTGAIVLPIGNTDQRPEAPIAGMVRINVDSAKLEFYDGTAWRTITST